MTQTFKRFCLALLFSAAMFIQAAEPVVVNAQVDPSDRHVEQLKADLANVIEPRPEVSRWAYINDSMVQVIKHLKEEAQAQGDAIVAAYNQIKEDSRAVEYEAAQRLVEEARGYEESLTAAQKDSLNAYSEALVSGDAEIKLSEEQDEATRRKRHNCFCSLLVRDCLRAGNLQVCGVANIGALNVAGSTSLGNTSIRTGSIFTVNGTSVFNGPATFNSTLLVNGTSNFAGDVVFSGIVTLPGGVIVGPGGFGDLTIGGDIIFNTSTGLPLNAVGAPEPLRAIRGVIDPNLLVGGGAIISGAGFTVDGTLLAVTVTFDTPFLDIPAVVISGSDTAGVTLGLSSVTTTGFTVIVTGVLPIASTIHFHALGARA